MNCPSTQKSSRWLEPGDNSRTHILSLFHIALLTTLKPRFQKRPCPAESQVLKGAGERKDHKPTAHAEVTEFSLTHTRPETSEDMQTTAGSGSDKEGGTQDGTVPTSPRRPEQLVEALGRERRRLEGGGGACGEGAGAGPARAQKLPQSDFPTVALQPRPCPCLKNFLNSIPAPFLPALKPYSVWTSIRLCQANSELLGCLQLSMGNICVKRGRLPCSSVRGVCWARIDHKGNCF